MVVAEAFTLFSLIGLLTAGYVCQGVEVDVWFDDTDIENHLCERDDDDNGHVNAIYRVLYLFPVEAETGKGNHWKKNVVSERDEVHDSWADLDPEGRSSLPRYPEHEVCKQETYRTKKA